MSDETTHVLTNSFLAVRLLALREQASTLDHGSGPFLVVQHALHPELPEVDPTDFLLTRRGSWLPLDAFVGLDWDEGREQAFFPSAADVMGLLKNLPSRPVVESVPPNSRGTPGSPDASNHPFFAAVLRAVRG
jgi:hypothetical protein